MPKNKEPALGADYSSKMKSRYSEKVKTHIEDFFRTRFIMYKEVYNHRTVRSIEYMMKEFITQLGYAIYTYNFRVNI